MRKLASAAAVTALAMSTSMIAITPAMALTPQQTMQAACDALKPAANWTATPNNVGSTSQTNVELSRVTTSNIPGGTLLSQTPFVFEAASEHRNGGSPNIFGTWKSIATYSGGELVQHVVLGTVTSYTYGCAMMNNGGNYPPAQQVPAALTLTDTVVTSEYDDIVAAPNTTQTVYDDRVICISPTKNPGVWRQQNGYTGVCSTAVFLTLGGGVHSNSVPDLVPLRPNAPDNQFVSPPNNDQYPLPPYTEE